MPVDILDSESSSQDVVESVFGFDIIFSLLLVSIGFSHGAVELGDGINNLTGGWSLLLVLPLCFRLFCINSLTPAFINCDRV